MTGEWAGRLLASHPRQPDQRSCGASVLVVERALRDEEYARQLVEGRGFRDDVLAAHRRTTGVKTAAGRLQLPWPRALGTPPWAIANELGAVTGRDWMWRPAVFRRAAGLERLVAAVGDGSPCPAYVGSTLLPRHVVLVVAVDGENLRCYEPNSGRVLTVTHSQFLAGGFRLAGWTTPWFVVVPR